MNTDQKTINYKSHLENLDDDQLESEFTEYFCPSENYFILFRNNTRENRITALSERFEIELMDSPTANRIINKSFN